MEEREDARGVVAEAVLEIEVFVLLGAPPAFGSAGRLGSGILCVAFFDDAIVSGDEGDFFGVEEGLEIKGSIKGSVPHIDIFLNSERFLRWQGN